MADSEAVLAAARDLAAEVGLVVVEHEFVDRTGRTWAPIEFASAVSARLAAQSVKQRRSRVRSTVNKLTRLRGSLGTRLLAESEHAYDAALRQAGVRVKARSRSRLSATRHTEVQAAVDGREPLKAWIGAVGITELEMLRGSFDVLGERAADDFVRYWTRAVKVCAAVGIDAALYIDRDATEQAVEYLVTSWSAMARKRLLVGDEALLAAMAARLGAGARGFDLPADPTGLRAPGAAIIRNAIRINEGAAAVTYGSTPDEAPEVHDAGEPTLETRIAIAGKLIGGAPRRPGPGARTAAAPKPPVITSDMTRAARRQARRDYREALAEADRVAKGLAQPAIDREYIANRELSLGQRGMTPEMPEALAARRERAEAARGTDPMSLAKKLDKLDDLVAENERLFALTPAERLDLSAEEQIALEYGTDVATDLETAPDALWTWVHGFYGEPKTPFDPHDNLDGLETNDDADERLVNDESWPDTDFFFPGDHDTCTCDWVLLA